MNPSKDPEAFLVVRVKPRAARAGLLGRHGAGVKVAVRAVPERGKANDELLRLLAKVLQVPTTALAVVGGEHAQDKRLRVSGITAVEMERRLAAALGEERE